MLFAGFARNSPFFRSIFISSIQGRFRSAALASEGVKFVPEASLRGNSVFTIGVNRKQCCRAAFSLRKRHPARCNRVHSNCENAVNPALLFRGMYGLWPVPFTREHEIKCESAPGKRIPAVRVSSFMTLDCGRTSNSAARQNAHPGGTL